LNFNTQKVVQLVIKMSKIITGIDDEVEVEGDPSDDEEIEPETEYDRGFVNNEPVREYPRNKRAKLEHTERISSKPEHIPDGDKARTKPYDVLRFGNFAAKWVPLINSETNAPMEQGHAELLLFFVQVDEAGKVIGLEKVPGIRVEVGAMPTALEFSYVDILTFNVNTLGKRDELRVREYQATILGVMCSSFTPGTIIKSTDGWMEFEGEVDGTKSLDAMAQRFTGIYHVDPDTDAIVFHAGEFEKEFRNHHSP
jgi:hypothetical protein